MKAIRDILVVVAAIAIVAAFFDAARFAEVQFYWPFLLALAVACLGASHMIRTDEERREP
jgi:uncharacterized membrane protein YqhA